MKYGKNFQDIISSLNEYWKKQGCILVQPYDMEKGAGTFNPATVLGALTKTPVNRAYVEPCRRPADGRYGENPNRLGKYYQYQVIMKPAPANIQEIYLNYFQNMAGYALNPITVEITYGLERIAMYCQKVDNVFDIRWNDTVTYREVHQEGERQFSHYYFEESNVDRLRRDIEENEAECHALCKKGLYLPAYECAMRVSHYFNMLEARGAISVSDRTNIITKIRNLAKACAKVYVDSVEPKEEKKEEAAQ